MKRGEGIFVAVPAAALVTYLGYKMWVVFELQHFKMDDFRGWWPWLSVGFLKKLDAFADQLGRPVMISPTPGALVRMRTGEEGEKDTDHFYGRGGDIMLPQGPDLQTAAGIARQVGFNAIGVYPKWKPYQGLHVGIRYPADRMFTWGALKDPQGNQYYVSLDEALRYA